MKTTRAAYRVRFMRFIDPIHVAVALCRQWKTAGGWGLTSCQFSITNKSGVRIRKVLQSSNKESVSCFLVHLDMSRDLLKLHRLVYRS